MADAYRWARFGSVVAWFLLAVGIMWVWFWSVAISHSGVTLTNTNPINLAFLGLIASLGAWPFAGWIVLRWIVTGRWLISP